MGSGSGAWNELQASGEDLQFVVVQYYTVTGVEEESFRQSRARLRRRLCAEAGRGARW